jgi:uncharacterized protein involved in response to NO
MLLSFGFRPLFLCTVGSALIFVSWWLLAWYGIVPFPGQGMDPFKWHAHEMIFGMVGSAIGGFLLTAVSNWTRRPPVSGFPLALLVLFWLAARVVMGSDLGLSAIAIMAIDISYWLLLTILLAREVLGGRNFRNLRIVGILALFLGLNALFHLDAVLNSAIGSQALSIQGAMFLVCLLISVIGGRIIPAFTGNWLRLHHGSETAIPVSFNWFDGLAVGSIAVAGIAWLTFPNEHFPGVLALACGVLQLMRLSRWQGHRTFADPLVIILHVGYAWLGIGMLLLGASKHGLPVSAGLHALGVGAMSGLIVAVSSRAAMGHTNRQLAADRLLTSVFILINLAALARVAASLMQMNWLWVAGTLWLLAFILFGIKIGPMLVGPPESRESLPVNVPRKT